MNISKEIITRVEEARKTNKNPCPNYSTKSGAENAIKKAAKKVAVMLHKNSDENARPANYVVVFIESWGRWVGAYDLNEVLSRPDSIHGYENILNKHFSY